MTHAQGLVFGAGRRIRMYHPFLIYAWVDLPAPTGCSESAMNNPVEIRAKLFRGLSDVSRLMVLEALRDGPLCAGEIVERTGLTQPNASMHLACLAECGLVRWERQGRFVHYELADKRVVKLLDRADDLLLLVSPLIEACSRYGGSRRIAPTRLPRTRRA